MQHELKDPLLDLLSLTKLTKVERFKNLFKKAFSAMKSFKEKHIATLKEEVEVKPIPTGPEMPPTKITPPTRPDMVPPSVDIGLPREIPPPPGMEEPKKREPSPQPGKTGTPTIDVGLPPETPPPGMTGPT